MDENGDLDIAERSWKKSLASAQKEGFREGFESGRSGSFQDGFNIGYKSGFENAYAMGRLNGAIRVINEMDELSELRESAKGVEPIDKPFRGGCLICEQCGHGALSQFETVGLAGGNSLDDIVQSQREAVASLGQNPLLRSLFLNETKDVT